jgi:hypothetical protein
MPYPNEHSCRLSDPDKFQKDSFRRIKRGTPGQTKPDGRPLSIIIARPIGKTTMKTQAYRYPIGDWTEAAARVHCEDAGGTFEAAAKKEEKAMEEGSKADEDTVSLDSIRSALYNALNPPKGELKAPPSSIYVKDIYTDHAIVEQSGKLYKVPWSVGDDGMVEFGTMEEVRIEYVPVAKVKAFFGRLLGVLGVGKKTEENPQDEVLEKPLTGFKAFKDAEGKPRWVSWTTNAFKDLEKEIFATKALENYAGAAMEKGEHGELWIGHIPAKIGTPDGHIMLGRFLVETGLFDDTADGKKAAEFYLTAEEPLEMSHRYLYDRKDREDGVYEWVRILERSVLPAGTAANPWTSFTTLTKEAKEMPDAKTVAHFKKVLGEERYKELEGNTEALSKALEAIGVDFKGLEPKGEEPKKAEEPKVAPAPATATDEVKPAFAAAQKDFDALGQRVKASEEKLGGIEKALADLTAKVDALAKTDGAKIAQKAKEETPRAALWQASQAEETKVSAEEAKKAGGPKVPEVVQQIAAKVGG